MLGTELSEADGLTSGKDDADGLGEGLSVGTGDSDGLGIA